jgi:phage terminase large subunit
MQTEVILDDDLYLPVYRPLLDSLTDIDFLWGGRDSGKTRHIAMQMVADCLSLPYFRCVLVRKVFNTIKESQWQVIKDVVEEWGLEELFTFNKNPLEISCVNGNKFICRGMDEPGKLKSISNPSHCWGEEMNQLELDDFIVIMTSLRYNEGRVKVWCSFNPEADGDYNDYWLYKTFFKDKGYNFIDVWKIPVGERVIEFSYRSTHTTYKDNPYCKPERAAFLEQLVELDPYYYLVFTKGLWGNRRTEDPYCYAYDRDKHVGPVKLNKAHEVILSFDFNISPITCCVIQHQGSKIRVVEAIKKDNSDIYKILDYILAHYGGCMFLVTGDATGKNSSALVKDGINYYTVIKSKLKLSNGQLRVPSINPKVSENRMLVNSAFHSADIKADPIMAKNLIFDWQHVSVTDTGDIDKGDRNNPKKRSDFLDTWRYYLNTFHKNLLKS